MAQMAFRRPELQKLGRRQGR